MAKKKDESKKKSRKNRPMNGYRQAGRIDRLVSRLMGKTPMTKENALEYFRLGRSIRTTGVALEQQAAAMLGFKEYEPDVDKYATKARASKLREESQDDSDDDSDEE